MVRKCYVLGRRVKLDPPFANRRRFCWQLIMIMTFVQYTPASYGSGASEIVFPPLINLLGWLMAATPIVVVIAVGGYVFHKKVIKNDYVSLARAE